MAFQISISLVTVSAAEEKVDNVLDLEANIADVNDRAPASRRAGGCQSVIGIWKPLLVIAFITAIVLAFVLPKAVHPLSSAGASAEVLQSSLKL